MYSLQSFTFMVLAQGLLVSAEDSVIYFGEDRTGVVKGDSSTYPNATIAQQVFLNDLKPQVEIEDFSSFSSTTVGTVLTNTKNGITYDLESTCFIAQNDPVVGAPFATSPVNYLRCNPKAFADDNVLFKICFDQPIVAFGFFATDIENTDRVGFIGEMTFDLDNGNTMMKKLEISDSNAASGAQGPTFFYGIVNPAPFNCLTLSNTIIDGLGFDDFIFAQAGHLADDIGKPCTGAIGAADCRNCCSLSVFRKRQLLYAGMSMGQCLLAPQCGNILEL